MDALLYGASPEARRAFVAFVSPGAVEGDYDETAIEHVREATWAIAGNVTKSAATTEALKILVQLLDVHDNGVVEAALAALAHIVGRTSSLGPFQENVRKKVEVLLHKHKDDDVLGRSICVIANLKLESDPTSKDLMAQILKLLKQEMIDLTEKAYVEAIVRLPLSEKSQKEDMLELMCGLLSKKDSPSLQLILKEVERYLHDQQQMEACNVVKGCGGLANLSHLQHHQRPDISSHALRLINTYFGGETQYEVPEADFISKTFKKHPPLTSQLDLERETLPTDSFGEMVIPGQGNSKYLRVYTHTRPRPVMSLLTEQWNMDTPAFVISLFGSTYENDNIPKMFKEGVRRMAGMARCWVITSENTKSWAARVMGEIARDLSSSELSIIAFHKWDTLVDNKLLIGCNVGSKATYGYNIDDSSNDLDPNHTVHFFTDEQGVPNQDVTNGLRHQLEHFIRDSDEHCKADNPVGVADPCSKAANQCEKKRSFHVPVIHLVVGGDGSSLHRLEKALQQKMGIVIVNNSGGIADTLAQLYKEMIVFNRESQHSSHSNIDQVNNEHIEKLVNAMTPQQTPQILKSIKQIMNNDNMERICVFGEQDGDTKDLAEAIFTVIFKGTNRSNMLFHSLCERNTALAGIMLNKRYGGEIRLKTSLSIKQLSDLHKLNLMSDRVSSKNLKEKWDIREDIFQKHSLSQVGRILNKLLGDEYRMLYQEMQFDPNRESAEDEATWHVFLYAVLSNQPEVAQMLLGRIELRSKMAAALVAFHLMKRMAETAMDLRENECANHLEATADHFQTLAVNALSRLYESNRTNAYACLVSKTTFNWGSHVTPLSIASTAQASRLMDHAACHTLLNRVWLKNIASSTETWKKFPLFLVCPINVLFIKFDRSNLAFDENLASERRTDKSTVGLWFKFKSYYTCPMNIFMMHTMMWFLFLILFVHMLITKLNSSGTSISEFLVIFWVACLTFAELEQFLFGGVSSPIAKIKGSDWLKNACETFFVTETIYFQCNLHTIFQWSESGWNLIDAVMYASFWSAVACHYTLPIVSFGIVRIVYSISFIIFCFRTLHIGYIFESVGPRIISVYHLMRDLAQFLMILGVSLVGFGVAYQAILIPNQPPSFHTLASVLWRPYWQMYGELFLDDAQEGMGRDLPEGAPPVCTYNWTEALNSANTPYCYSWMAPVLEAVYMLFTNILLLNLLIAIFSTSFSKIEDKAREIWALHYYAFVHEYYHLTWLPAPLSPLCYLYRLIMWPFKRCLKHRQVGTDEKVKKSPPPGSYCILCEPQSCSRGIAQAEHIAFEAVMQENPWSPDIKPADKSYGDRLELIENIIKRLDVNQKETLKKLNTILKQKKINTSPNTNPWVN